MDAYGLSPARTGPFELRKADRSSMRKSAQQRLNAVWDDSAGQLLQLTAAMGIDHHRADDILQDVYLTAWQKSPPQADRDELRRWLLKVVANRCRLEHRRRTRWGNVFMKLSQWSSRGADSSDPAAKTTDTLEQDEEKQIIQQGLQQFAPEVRSVLVLRYFSELDSKQIGNVLEIPDSTVRSRLRAGRLRLAKELQKLGYEHDGRK